MYRGFLKTKLELYSLVALARYYDQHQVAIDKVAGDQRTE